MIMKSYFTKYIIYILLFIQWTNLDANIEISQSEQPIEIVLQPDMLEEFLNRMPSPLNFTKYENYNFLKLINQTAIIKDTHMPTNINNLSSCRDLKHEVLIDYFSKLLLKGTEIHSMIMTPSFTSNRSSEFLNIGDIENSNARIAKIYGKRKCEFRKARVLREKFDFCPWHYSLFERNDRFPFMRVSAVCNCKKCLLEEFLEYDHNKTEMGCVPIRIPMPALYRKECVNGIYKWVFAIEYVSVACTCAFKYKDIAK
jgi:hypothetical protein